MAYNPENLKEKEVPKVGTKMTGKVIEVNEGKWSNFVSKENLAKFKNYDPFEDVIEVVAELEDGTKVKRSPLSVPKDGQVHPKSNLGQWKKQYLGYPTIGQEIECIVGENGFWEFRA